MEVVLSDIAEAFAAGSAEALDECLRRVRPLLGTYLRRYLSSDESEDVAQNVFLEVWRSRLRYDPSRPLQGWILGIARKRAIDQLRKRRDPVVNLDAVRELVGTDGRDVVDRFVWADEMQQALDTLPEAQRQVIKMAYYEGYSQSAIAATLNVPIGTVKTRTARGLHRLHELMSAELESR